MECHDVCMLGVLCARVCIFQLRGAPFTRLCFIWSITCQTNMCCLFALAALKAGLQPPLCRQTVTGIVCVLCLLGSDYVCRRELS